LVGKDNLISTCFLRSLPFLSRRSYADDPGSSQFRHLAQQKSNPTGCGLDQAPIARLDRIGRVGEFVSDKPLRQPSRRHFKANVIGHRDQPIRRDECMSSVGPGVKVYTIIDLNAGNAWSEFLNDADSLTS